MSQGRVRRVFIIAIPAAAKRTIAGRLLTVSAPSWIAASALIVGPVPPLRASVTVAIASADERQRRQLGAGRNALSDRVGDGDGEEDEGERAEAADVALDDDGGLVVGQPGGVRTGCDVAAGLFREDGEAEDEQQRIADAGGREQLVSVHVFSPIVDGCSESVARRGFGVVARGTDSTPATRTRSRRRGPTCDRARCDSRRMIRRRRRASLVR